MVPHKISATTARAILLARYKQKPARQGPHKQLATPVATYFFACPETLTWKLNFSSNRVEALIPKTLCSLPYTLHKCLCSYSFSQTIYSVENCLLTFYSLRFIFMKAGNINVLIFGNSSMLFLFQDYCFILQSINVVRVSDRRLGFVLLFTWNKDALT